MRASFQVVQPEARRREKWEEGVVADRKEPLSTPCNIV